MASSNIKETREWDVESTILLINLFKDNECLYNNTHVDFTNKEIRQDVICKMAKTIEEKSAKACSVADVSEKVGSLWSQYLAEKQKILNSNNIREQYTSAKYWFPLLQFLDSYTNPDLEFNIDIVPPYYYETVADLPLIKNKEQEPPKPPRRRKKPTVDNISMTSFSINPPISKARSYLTTDSHPHITTFCSFIQSELICIKESGGDEFLKKAKRKLQVALFDVWDEIESLNDDVE